MILLSMCVTSEYYALKSTKINDKTHFCVTVGFVLFHFLFDIEFDHVVLLCFDDVQ